MKITKTGDITDIDGLIRIEPGHVRKRAVATKELLDDAVTAKHYQVGQIDASGKPIEIGKEMDYIDWRSRDRVFYLYQKDNSGQWLPIGEPKPDYDAALASAVELVVNGVSTRKK